MPKYDMKCVACGHTDTVEMSLTEYISDGAKCSECDEKMQRCFVKGGNVQASVVGVRKGYYNSSEGNVL